MDDGGRRGPATHGTIAAEVLPAAAERAPSARRGIGLSGRLLVLTIAFVMLAEVLIYVPSVARFQNSWLSDRLAAAQIAALVLDADAEGPVGEAVERKLLEGVGAELVAVRGGGTRRLLAMDTMPPAIDRTVDLRDQSLVDSVRAAFATLTRPNGGAMRVIGPGTGAQAQEIDFVEIVIDPAPLRTALIGFSINILILSLIISAITAGLVFLALELVIVRPVRRLSTNIARFSEEPEDAARIIVPSDRTDEIGVAERALERTERALAQELRATRRLAELGLGVAKINHDLRNMLASAQLVADRMVEASDPTVQRFAPRLVATLQRAIDFSEATLAYGRAVEPEPDRRPVRLLDVLADLDDVPGLSRAREDGEGTDESGEGPVRLVLAVPDDLLVDADRAQLARVFVNLARNAVRALAKAPSGARALTIEAWREEGACHVRVSDNGPGLPARAVAHLFEAFKGASGGTGLGLAICAEIVRLHGGRIAHEPDRPGACFLVVVPDREKTVAA
ncbi:sensor histidine kinase [Salinarimonas sp.]|uniref:sensor histidine kinase n=1 Tax=Salinarimonas sp. TaxID=2766526 RepID=UPI00391DCA35